MENYWIFQSEIKRREKFILSVQDKVNCYELYNIKSIIELNRNSDTILENTFLEIIQKSLKQTNLYYFLENKSNNEDYDLERINDIINENFDYKYYYINYYQNPISEFKSKYLNNVKTEKIMHELIQKSFEFSLKETKQTLDNIIKYKNNWSNFCGKELLNYELLENLKNKGNESVIKL